MGRKLIVLLVIVLIFASAEVYTYLTRKVPPPPPKIEMALVPRDNSTDMILFPFEDFGGPIRCFFPSDNITRDYVLEMRAGRVYVISIDVKTEYGEHVEVSIWRRRSVEVGKIYVFEPPLG